MTVLEAIIASQMAQSAEVRTYLFSEVIRHVLDKCPDLNLNTLLREPIKLSTPMPFEPYVENPQ